MISIIQQSCLEKIRADATTFKEPYQAASALVGEEFAYQIVLYSDCDRGEPVSLRLECGADAELYEVKQVPVNWPHYADDPYKHYLLDSPDLLPDALVPIGRSKDLVINRNVTVLWVSVTATFPGDYEIELFSTTEEGTQRNCFLLHVLPFHMSESWFNHCQYIDPASIAKAYGKPMFCNVHWELLEKYFKIASDHGIVNILTPIFPPIYGEYPIGSEEVQLVRIAEENDDFTFDYDLLDCWILLAKKSGIKKLTFPPIFPSVESLRCPNIKVTHDRREGILFDSETKVSSSDFMNFIRKFLRSLMKHMAEIGADDMMCFQVTNEPSVQFSDNYAKCRSFLEGIVNRHQIADTMVPIEFYETNLGSAPFFAVQDIEDLLNLPGDRYLCTDISSTAGVTNFLIASPSLRIRAFGTLCYRHHISALFNLWFNNYFAAGSSRADVFLNTANENAFPSGSGFLVYPGLTGPIPSIRLKQLRFAFQDMRVLSALERFIPYSRIISKIDKKLSIRLTDLPVNNEKFLAFREEVYASINNSNLV